MHRMAMRIFESSYGIVYALCQAPAIDDMFQDGPSGSRCRLQDTDKPVLICTDIEVDGRRRQMMRQLQACYSVPYGSTD